MPDGPMHRAAHVESWEEVPAPRGGSWLVWLCLSARCAAIVAPPAVAIAPGERADELASWRAADWPLDSRGWLARTPGLSLPVQVLSTSGVLARLPVQHHAWVEDTMRVQLAQLEAFATPQAGGLSDEERSRSANRQLVALRGELREAFPDGDWYEGAVADIPPVPNTQEALLAAIDGRPSEVPLVVSGRSMCGKARLAPRPDASRRVSGPERHAGDFDDRALPAVLDDDQRVQRLGVFAGATVMGRSAEGSLRLRRRTSIAWLGIKTRSSARREAANDRLKRAEGDLREAAPAYQAHLEAKLSDSWLASLAAINGQVFAALNADLASLHRKRVRLEKDVLIARQKAQYEPKFNLDITVQVALALATALAMLTTWSFLQDLQWPFPITLLAAISLGTFEVAAANTCGYCWHARVLDDAHEDPDTPFKLTPGENRLYAVIAAGAGVISTAAAIVLAIVRSEGGEPIIWLVVGFGLVVLSIYSGMTVADNKYRVELAQLLKEWTKTNAQIDTLKNRFVQRQRDTLVEGKALCAAAAEIDHRAAQALTASRRRPTQGEVAPAVPTLRLPTEQELRDRLLLEIFDPLQTRDVVDCSSSTRTPRRVQGPRGRGCWRLTPGAIVVTKAIRPIRTIMAAVTVIFRGGTGLASVRP